MTHDEAEGYERQSMLTWCECESGSCAEYDEMVEERQNLRDALSQLLDRLDHHGSIDPIREEGPIQDARDALEKAKP